MVVKPGGELAKFVGKFGKLVAKFAKSGQMLAKPGRELVKLGGKDDRMKISKIKIKRLFGISEQALNGGDVELTGRNGAGKSSVLDAIKYALTNNPQRKFVVKSGETEGEIIIETDSGLEIDRRPRTDRGDYVSVKQGGMALGSPETTLRSLFVPMQLNPMEFMQMREREQNAVLLDMIDFEWDMGTIKDWFGEIPQDVNYDQNILSVLNDIQAENGYYFQTRQDVNRDIRAKKSIAADIAASLPPDYDGEEWEGKSLGDLYARIERIRSENASIERARQVVEGQSSRRRKFEADREIALAALDREMSAEAGRIDTELATLRERIQSLTEKKESLASLRAGKAEAIEGTYTANVASLGAEAEAAKGLAEKELTPLGDLQKEASNAEKMKSHVAEWRRMLSTEREIEKLQERSDSLTAKIEKARRLPGEILATASIPIEGLTVKDGVPLINGLPVSNLSDGEKLSLCVDVAVQNRSGLQIILIDGAERLTDENRRRLYDRCKSKGVQFIATRTTNDDELVVTEL